jgi:transcriptional regulator with XRE-family HTH domain
MCGSHKEHAQAFSRIQDSSMRQGNQITVRGANMRGKKSKIPKTINPTLGKMLRALRNERHLTQKQVAEALLTPRVDTYSEFERGVTKPTPETLKKLRRIFDLGDDDWRELCAIYMGDEEPALQLDCLVLDEIFEVPSNIRFLYERYGKELLNTRTSTKTSPTFGTADQREWTARICHFEDRVFIITGAMENEHKDFSIPETDQRAAEDVQSLLKKLTIDSQYDHCRSARVPDNYDEDLVLICGPAHNKASAVINEKFQQNETWFQGFYFSQAHVIAEDAVRPVGWSIRHRALPEVNIRFEDLAHQVPGGGFEYQKSENGYAHDFGLVYVGPNPLDMQHWLVMAAGLGPNATYGMAVALKQPRIVELLGRALRDRRRYCSGLIEYCFFDEPHKKYDGHISRVLLTKGTVYSDA